MQSVCNNFYDFYSLSDNNIFFKFLLLALDCLRYMINGSSLIKVRPSARQYRRFFSLEEDLSALKWIPSSKKSSKARSMYSIKYGIMIYLLEIPYIF